MAEEKLDFEIGARTRDGESALERFARHFQHLERVVAAAHRGMAAAARISMQALQGLTRTVEQLSQRLLQAAQIGALALTGALAALAKQGVDVNLTVGGAEKAIAKISGSAGMAKQFIGALRKEAETSASTFKDMVANSQALAAVYIEKYGPAGLGKVIPTMRAFADAAATLSVSKEGQELALFGFRQLVSEPDPSLENLKQVDEAFPGAGVRSIVRAAFGSDETETLKKAQVTGAMVGEAILKGLQAKFAGAQKAAANSLPIILSNLQDALDGIASKVTSKFLPIITRAAQALLKFMGALEKTTAGKQILKVLSDGFDDVGRSLQFFVNGFQSYLSNLTPFIQVVLRGVASLVRGFAELAANRAFIGGLAAGFQALGGTVQFLARQAALVATWFGKVASASNVLTFLVRVSALVATIAEGVLRLVGIDLKAWLDPNTVIGFFEGLWRGVEGAAKLFFALSRTAVEAFLIIKSAIQDVTDFLYDRWEDATTFFKRKWEDVELWFSYTLKDSTRDIRAFGGEFIRTINEISNSIYALVEGMALIPKVGEAIKLVLPDIARAFLGGVDAGVRLQQSDPTLFGVDPLEAQRREWMRKEGERQRADQDLETYFRRSVRGANRIVEDPRRRMNPGDRISGAFSGAFGKPEEDAFFGRFREWQDFFFRTFKGEALPQMRPDNGRAFSLHNVETPAYPYERFGLTPPGGGAPGGYDFTPIRLPNGQVIARGAAALQGAMQGAPSGGPGTQKEIDAYIGMLDKTLKGLDPAEKDAFRRQKLLPALQRKAEMLGGQDLQPGETMEGLYKRLGESDEAWARIQEIMSGEAGKNDFGRGRGNPFAGSDQPFGGMFSPANVNIGSIMVPANGDAAILRDPRFREALGAFIAEYLQRGRQYQYGR